MTLKITMLIYCTDYVHVIRSFDVNWFVIACDEEWRRMAIAAAAETQRLLSPAMSGLGTPLRTQTANPLGAPLILSPRIPTAIPTTAASILNGSPAAQQLLPPEPHGLIYTPFTADYANFAALTGSPLLTAEYPAPDHSGGLFVR